MFFSTCGLMLLAPTATLAAVVIRYALCFGDHGEFVIGTVLILALAFGAPIFVGGKLRTFCNGFVGAGALYFGLSMFAGFHQARWDFDHVPITSLYCRVFDAAATDPSFHSPRPRFESPWEYPSAEERRNLFLRAAHSLTSLVVGAFGGTAALIVQHRRLERAQRREARADALIASDAQGEPIRKWQCPAVARTEFKR